MTDVACDACCMRTGISINISASDRERLEAMVAVRNSPQSMSGARGSSCSAPWRGHDGDHGWDRQIQDLCLAMAAPPGERTGTRSPCQNTKTVPGADMSH
jgi:hypothetical protein